MAAKTEISEKIGHTVPAVAKAVAIIRMLNMNGSDGAALPDIATELQMSRSHCHNILRTLVDSGWLFYDSTSRLFRLTGLISADTAAGLVSEPYLGHFRSILDQHSRSLEIPFSATEPLQDGTFLQLIITAHARAYVPSVPPGFRFPVGAPIYFKARWTWADEKSRDTAIDELPAKQFTPRTITDKQALRDALKQARKRGYAHAFAEYIDGFGSVGLPVFNSSGEVIMVVSCATRLSDLDVREEEIASALIACVHECHMAIDGRPPVDFPRPGMIISPVGSSSKQG